MELDVSTLGQLAKLGVKRLTLSHAAAAELRLNTKGRYIPEWPYSKRRPDGLVGYIFGLEVFEADDNA